MDVIIVDDEIDALESIERAITDIGYGINNIFKATTVNTAIRVIDQKKPGLLFLDIKLGDGTGFDVLKNVEYKNFKTIFITAYDQYAVEAFRVKAVNYLLKPINPVDLANTVNDVLMYQESKDEFLKLRIELENQIHEKIGLPYKGKIMQTPLNRILRMEADGNYTRVYLVNKPGIIVAKTLKIFEKLLVEKQFVRVHHSHLVNAKYIQSFNKKENFLVLTDEQIVPVSRRLKNELKKIIQMQLS